MKATEVTAGLVESNGSLLPGLWRDSLHVTCGLTACRPGSAPGPTLGNEYGKTLPFFSWRQCAPHLIDDSLHQHKSDSNSIGRFIRFCMARRCAQQTDEHTDRGKCDSCNNRPHLCVRCCLKCIPPWSGLCRSAPERRRVAA